MPDKKTPGRHDPTLEDTLTQVALHRMRSAASYPRRRNYRPLVWALAAVAVVAAVIAILLRVNGP